MRPVGFGVVVIVVGSVFRALKLYHFLCQ